MVTVGTRAEFCALKTRLYCLLRRAAELRNGNCSSKAMVFSLLSSAQAADLSEDLGDLLLAATMGLLLVGGVVWLLFYLTRSGTPAPSSRRAPRVASAPARGPARSRLKTPRRVIPLPAETPGQSPHEYNLGDTSGARGSAWLFARQRMRSGE